MERRSALIPLEISCVACHYLVFKDRKEAITEICPVCGWQNDGTKGDVYSESNHSTLHDYQQSERFRHNCLINADCYMKSPY